MDTKKACNLYIYLGLDSIYGLNLNHLLLSSELEKVFTLPDTVSEDPLKGLFVLDSKLHCLGGVGKFPFTRKAFSFNLPSFAPDHSTHFPCYSSSYMKFRPILFTISNKVYALETTPVGSFGYCNTFFQVFEPEIGEWKFLPQPPSFSFDTLVVFQNNILLQTFDKDFIFDAKAQFPDWKKITNKFFPRMRAALEHQDFIFVLSEKPYKLVVYKLASFGEEDCFSRELDIWNDCFNFCQLHIHWASLSLVGKNRICLVFISQYKIHISVIRFMKTFIYAELEAYQEYYIPESMKSSAIPHCSTFLWSPDMNQHEREENPTISLHHSKADQIEENSMNRNQADQIVENSMDYNQDRYLYIYLGFGALLSLNFNELCKKDKSSLGPKLDLQLVFSHHNKGTEFPIGMGLLIRDSKLHFFGGENLEDSEDNISYQDSEFLKFRGFVGLNPNVRPKYGKHWYEKASASLDEYDMDSYDLSDDWFDKVELDNGWINKKFYSFNLPYFTSYDDPLPNHSGCKFRPLVFTISGKYYALSTRTVSISLSSFKQVDEGKLKLFEVLEPEKNEWRHLKLPSSLFKEILHNTLSIESHCVFRNKMLLQTSTKDYVFDSVSEGWTEGAAGWYPRIHTALEYNEVLLVLSRNPVELLVYELASFGEKDPTFGKLDMNKEVIEFFKHSIIFGASLSLVDHNRISLVLITMKDILVVVFKVEAPFICAAVEAHKVFDVPKNCFFDIKPCSTFLLCSDAKAADPREENSTVSQRDMLERNAWRFYKEHFNKWATRKLVMPNFCPNGNDLHKWAAGNLVMPNFCPNGSYLNNDAKEFLPPPSPSFMPNFCPNGSDMNKNAKELLPPPLPSFMPNFCPNGSYMNNYAKEFLLPPLPSFVPNFCPNGSDLNKWASGNLVMPNFCPNGSDSNGDAKYILPPPTPSFF